MCFHHLLRLDDSLSLQSVLNEGTKLLHALEPLYLAAEVNFHGLFNYLVLLSVKSH
jgi:hypothetical protein